jgi:hypothetical protein
MSVRSTAAPTDRVGGQVRQVCMSRSGPPALAPCLAPRGERRDLIREAKMISDPLTGAFNPWLAFTRDVRLVRAVWPASRITGIARR